MVIRGYVAYYMLVICTKYHSKWCRDWLRRSNRAYWMGVLRVPASLGTLFPVNHCFLIFLAGARVYRVSDYYGYSIGGRVVGGGRKLG